MRALVTGGGGFLGGAIVRLLLKRGWRVRSYSRGEYPALRQLDVEQVKGDLAEGAGLAKAVAGCDVVFHVAAKAGVWGSYQEYHQINVVGTENVLQACKAAGIRKLVFTSSPSVTFDGRDQVGLDESAPYPSKWLAHYPHTKALAEQRVLAANGPDLTTVSLRPHLIWGPGDPHLVPRVLERAKAGQLRLVGDQSKKVDSVYIDNAAEAHVLAAEKLAVGAPLAGKAYFITNGEPLPMAELLNGILKAGGLPPVTRTISARLAYAAGVVFEMSYRLLGKSEEPRMTRFVARQLSTAHWFDISAARRDFGYEPAITIREGMQLLAADLNHQAD